MNILWIDGLVIGVLAAFLLNWAICAKESIVNICLTVLALIALIEAGMACLGLHYKIDDVFNLAGAMLVGMSISTLLIYRKKK